jgi:hypothetical protein
MECSVIALFRAYMVADMCTLVNNLLCSIGYNRLQLPALILVSEVYFHRSIDGRKLEPVPRVAVVAVAMVNLSPLYGSDGYNVRASVQVLSGVAALHELRRQDTPQGRNGDQVVDHGEQMRAPPWSIGDPHIGNHSQIVLTQCSCVKKLKAGPQVIR